MKQYSLLLILCAAVGLSSCNNTAQPKAAAFDVAGMDTTIQPGDNFFTSAAFPLDKNTAARTRNLFNNCKNLFDCARHTNYPIVPGENLIG